MQIINRRLIYKFFIICYIRVEDMGIIVISEQLN